MRNKQRLEKGFKKSKSKSTVLLILLYIAIIFCLSVECCLTFTIISINTTHYIKLC